MCVKCIPPKEGWSIDYITLPEPVHLLEWDEHKDKYEGYMPQAVDFRIYGVFRYIPNV